jgi:hypothetical protein
MIYLLNIGIDIEGENQGQVGVVNMCKDEGRRVPRKKQENHY